MKFSSWVLTRMMDLRSHKTLDLLDLSFRYEFGKRQAKTACYVKIPRFVRENRAERVGLVRGQVVLRLFLLMSTIYPR